MIPNNRRKEIVLLETIMARAIAPYAEDRVTVISAMSALLADTITGAYGTSEAAIMSHRALEKYFGNLADNLEKNTKIVKSLNPTE